MMHWDRIPLLVRSLALLGSLTGGTLPSQVALLEQAAPLRGLPGQYRPAHVAVIPGKALIPAAIQAVLGLEIANDWRNVRSQPLHALAPGGVGIPRACLALRRATHTRHLRCTQTGLRMPCVMHAAIRAQCGRQLAKHGAPAR